MFQTAAMPPKGSITSQNRQRALTVGEGSSSSAYLFKNSRNCEETIQACSSDLYVAGAFSSTADFSVPARRVAVGRGGSWAIAARRG